MGMREKSKWRAMGGMKKRAKSGKDGSSSPFSGDTLNERRIWISVNYAFIEKWNDLGKL